MCLKNLFNNNWISGKTFQRSNIIPQCRVKRLVVLFNLAKSLTYYALPSSYTVPVGKRSSILGWDIFTELCVSQKPQTFLVCLLHLSDHTGFFIALPECKEHGEAGLLGERVVVDTLDGVLVLSDRLFVQPLVFCNLCSVNSIVHAHSQPVPIPKLVRRHCSDRKDANAGPYLGFPRKKILPRPRPCMLPIRPTRQTPQTTRWTVLSSRLPCTIQSVAHPACRMENLQRRQRLCEAGINHGSNRWAAV
mmetsp:Transcript_8285/g.13416  ORF Transcript_8285/g.13416 Transcript_8285/m.13416 type:complete len:248 (-) Transcript_8285:1074-1817(-)